MGDRVLIAAGTRGPAFERASSSDGRASALQAEGRGFDSLLVHAASATDSKGADSSRPRAVGGLAMPEMHEAGGRAEKELQRDDGGNGAQGEPATPFERGHGTPADVATYGSQELEGTGVPSLEHPSPTTAPGCLLSPHGLMDVIALQQMREDVTMADTRDAFARLLAELREVKAENRRLKTCLRWWMAAASMPTDQRGVLVRGDALSGEVGRG